MINGTMPTLGARVYDIQLGYGTIQSVEPDQSFVVDFGNSKSVRYANGGYLGQSRRIYWNNPIIVEPDANDTGWGIFVSTVNEMYTLFKKLRSKG